MIRRHLLGLGRVAAPTLGIVLVASFGPVSAQQGGPEVLELDPRAERVEIRRTSYGVPHLLAEDVGAMGYGLAWVMMEDYREAVPRALLRSNGRWGLVMGADSMAADFAGRLAHEYATETYHLLPTDVREVLAGFAAGVNDFIRRHPEQLAPWVRPEFTPHDVAARDIAVWDAAAIRAFARLRAESAPTAGLETPAHAPTQQAARVGTSRSDLLGRWMAWGSRDGEADPEVGSNAWALAPERTTSGHAILLRNPHLSWTAGYYEAHVRVPGVVDFYGDFRLGGPFTTIGGFNRRLGWATTNNYPQLDQLYALTRDPADPDAYVFDGGSVPIRRRVVEIEYRAADGSIGRAVEAMPHTPLGPIVHETPDSVYVIRAHRFSQYRVGEQWLRMMQASNFDEWTAAMQIRAKVSSNLTYADADGVIHMVWNAALPALGHPASPHPVAVRSSDEIWSELVPWHDLPQVTNPPGGYVQNANDPPHYTNLEVVAAPGDYPANVPEPLLRLRSQNSLALIAGHDLLSLEDVVARKHDMGMVLADRMKDDLMRRVARWLDEGVSAEVDEAEVRRALDVLRAWDNTAARDSRGSSLFELWANHYMQSVPADRQYAEPWSAEAPMTTPRGLGDPDAAVVAFMAALDEAVRRWGDWDVTWGEVHRLRSEHHDLPIGGCASALGCFRVLGYVDDDDGRYRVHRGDGWVLAVEFGDPPRAWSVLAYGNSDQPNSELYYDQAELFADNRMKPVAFTEADIALDLVRRYRPGDPAP